VKWIFLAVAAFNGAVAIVCSLDHESPVVPFTVCLGFSLFAWVKDGHGR